MGDPTILNAKPSFEVSGRVMVWEAFNYENTFYLTPDRADDLADWLRDAAKVAREAAVPVLMDGVCAGGGPDSKYHYRVRGYDPATREAQAYCPIREDGSEIGWVEHRGLFSDHTFIPNQEA